MRGVLLIFRKETREMLRDRRVITGAFVAPIFLIVMMLALFGFVSDTIKKPKAPKLAIIASHTPSDFERKLSESRDLQVTQASSRAEGQKLLEEGKVKAVLEFDPDFETELAKGGAKLTVYYDDDEPTSQIAVGALEASVSKANHDAVAELFKGKGLSSGLAEPIVLEKKAVPKPEGIGSSMLVGLLPYLIVIWAFYGGFSIVSDLVAGEKERGTMETLLITPAHRWQIALGKFLALCTVCFVSAMTSLVGVVVVGVLNLPFTKNLFPEGVHFSITAIGAIMLVLIPLVGFFGGVLLAVSAYAKNMREAQTYLTLVSFIVLMPAIFSQFIGFTDLGKQAWVAFTPILNSSVAIREALLGKPDWGHIGIAVGINLVFAALGVRLVVWLFNREQILGRV